MPEDLVRPGCGGAAAAAEEAAYEPFDTRKRQRIADRIAEEERLLEEVAALKRSVPAAAATRCAARVREGIQRDEELLQLRVAELAAPPPPGSPIISIDALPRQDAVEASFRAAVDALGRLKRDMPAVVAKMERARVAGEYVTAERPR